MSRPEALRRARDLRQELRDTAEVFDQGTFLERLAERCADLKESALEGLVSWAGEKVDKEADGSAGADGQGLLPGFDVDGDYKLGDGGRIAKKYARIDHMTAAIALSDANLENVRRANELMHEELDRLKPYWKKGMRKHEAIARYHRANPEQAAG